MRTTNAIERLHGGVQAPGEDPMHAAQQGGMTAILFWAMMASGQITMRRVDSWQTLDQAPVEQPIDLAA